MKFRTGIPVVDGVVIGEAFVLDAERYRITQRYLRAPTPSSTEDEVQRFLTAVQASVTEVEALRDSFTQENPNKALESSAFIFEFLAGLYTDPSFQSFVRARITNSSNSPEGSYTAEHAVSKYAGRIRKQFANHAFYSQRIPDIDDFEQRLLRHLLGAKRETIKNLTKAVIIVARDLAPGQVADLPLEWVRGIATDRGGQTSHTAIIAQSRRIPAVVGLGAITGDVTGGETIILDGREGRVIIDPDPSTLDRYKARQAKFNAYLRELDELLSLPAETRDGHALNLYANIEYPDEIENALSSGAQGIGLYRTEFLYDQYDAEPSEDQHLQAYTRAVELLGDRPLVIRTLDLGADKFIPEGFGTETNPFLGCRSIRYCLFERRDVFERQLRAILRASARGDVRIMLPMVSSLEELEQAKAVIEQVKEDLLAQGHDIRRQIPIGIMIEVPSAALLADVLAQHCDFFSIGTNDLVQYTLAVDRVNERVAPLYQPTHPAIFRLLLTTIEAARRNKIPVSICGELSGEPHFTLPLVGLGMRDLSMASSSIPKIKRFIRSISANEAGRAIDVVLNKHKSTESLEYLHQRARAIDPLLYNL